MTSSQNILAAPAASGDVGGIAQPASSWQGLGRGAPALLVLYAAQLFAAFSESVDFGSDAVSQSIAWFATGVGIAGVWLLGLRAVWVVALASLTQRFCLGYSTAMLVPESIGSGLEAAVGGLVLRRCGLRPEFARLRDVGALALAATIAPFASMATSFAGRALRPIAADQIGLLSGWFGWWRMNALGAVAVVPIALTWHARLRRPLHARSVLEGTAFVAVTALLLTFVAFYCVPSTTGITALHAVLAVALVAALRQGPIGASTIATFGAVFVAVATKSGFGPFQCVPFAERHAAAQVFLLTLVSVPLVFGALIAERADHARQWLRSEDSRRALLAVLPDATVRLDAKGHVRDVYVAPDQDLLLPRTAVVGRPLPPLGPPSDSLLAGRLADAFTRAAAGLRPEPIDYALRRADGERACEARFVPAPDGDVLAVLRDVTPQRNLEAQLRHAQKLEAVGLLAGGLAHDFNNLLTIVAGNAEALRDEAIAGSPRHERANEIVETAVRGANLTRQLLVFSRQQVLRLEVFELGAAVAQFLVLLRRLLGADVDVTAVNQAPAWIRVDRGQLEQVVMNLAVNARDAMPNGGNLTITTRVLELSPTAATAAGLAPGSFAELEVRDSGHGMTAAVLARAFEPFFTTKEPGRGTGLGLSTVYGIARQVGGTVTIDSAPDAGTTVRLWLPSVAAPPIAPQVANSAPAAATGTPGVILVAEDEPAVRELLRRFLVRAGHRVILAEDGEDALAQAAAHGPFDLLVTDLVMPRMGGLELARRCRATSPSLPVLFVSAHPRGSDGLDIDAFVPADFLAKPFTADELVAKAASLLVQRS